MDNVQIETAATQHRRVVVPIIWNNIDKVASNIFENGFKTGAMWMQKNVFSQEDVISIIYEYELYRLECEAKNLKVTTITKWFETIRVQ